MNFHADLRAAIRRMQPVCLAATAFALVHLLDALDAHRPARHVPPGSRVMETGGFKGRSRTVPREELYDRICDRFWRRRPARSSPSTG